MLRDRLKDLDLRITELADYLQVSRPTMYKFIEYFDLQEFDLINKKVLKLFNYINDNDLIGKKNVVNYILTNLVDIKELGNDDEKDIFKVIKKYIVSNPESKKSKFIMMCVSNNIYDDVINYLVDIQQLLKKKNLTLDEKEHIKAYENLKKEILEKGDN